MGAIYRTSDPRFVYKEYLTPDKAPPRAAVDRLVRLGREVVLDRVQDVGATPESSVNWPMDVVADPAGRVRGVLLPAIPTGLFNDFGKPRTLEFLIMARAAPPEAQVRVVLLLRMAEILGYLDGQGLVHGDINGRNLAWCGAPDPVMYLIDCDGLVPRTPAPTTGVQALGWTDPRVVDRRVPAHDHFSDWYALALAMYRGLLLVPGNLTAKGADGTWPRPTRIPRELDGRVARLLHRALDDPLDAAGRPNPGEWVQALLDAYIPGGSFDLTALAGLDRVAQPGPAPAPTPAPLFVRIPPIRTPQPAPPPVPMAVPRPPPVPVPPPVTFHHAPVPAPPALPAPPPAPAVRNAGWFARQAMRGQVAWHLTAVGATCCCWPVGLVFLVITTVQLVRAPTWHAGRTRALVCCAAYGALALLSIVFTVVSELTQSPTRS